MEQNDIKNKLINKYMSGKPLTDEQRKSKQNFQRSMSLRRGKTWSINECLQLHREYELLNMSIDNIADKHGRTQTAIIYKLHQEGICDFEKLYKEYWGN